MHVLWFHGFDGARLTVHFAVFLGHSRRYTSRMIQMNTFLSMCSVCLASGALITGTFGMNLSTGLESHPYAFAGAMGAVLTTTYTMYHRLYQVCAC
jgi:Mg2+ and Co2+ transporter CorA